MSYALTIWGWLLMIFCVGSITLLVSWCFVRVLSQKGSVDTLEPPIEFDTHDHKA